MDSTSASRFPKTRWSVVLAFQAQGDDAYEALSKLCTLYWKPIYWHIRLAHGRTHNDASDLTQDFFRMLLARDDFLKPDQVKGKLRTFLLTALKNFMITEWKRQRTQRRGAGAVHISIDDGLRYAEANFAEPGNLETAYDVQWALAIFRQAADVLREEYRKKGKDEALDLLMEVLAPNSRQLPFAEIASRLGITEGGARTTAHRLRQRMGRLMREAILETVGHPSEVNEEFSYLKGLLHIDAKKLSQNGG